MFAEFKHTLRHMRGQMIGWGIGLALYVVLMGSFYSSIAGMGNLMEEFLQVYPKEMLAFFGSIMEINTPPGYLDIYYFNYMAVIIGIFAVGASASLLVGDEEKGILDLVMAHPVSRTALFWGRLLGFVAATAVILLVSWLSWVIPSGRSGLELTWIEFLQPFLPLFAELLLFGTLALLLSMVLPSARMAGMTTGGFLIANYLLIGLANINQDLKPIVQYTPLHYYQGGYAVSGLNWGWLAGLLAVSVAFVLLAWWRFQRRDIRVGGEGGWRLPSLPFRRRALPRVFPASPYNQESGSSNKASKFNTIKKRREKMNNQQTFFDFAAEVGITKHIGSLEATEALIELCHIGEGKYVLDVGCGVGVTPCSIARRYGCRVVGVDILEAMVERSKERAKRERVMDWIEFRVADAQDLPFEDDLFDAVITESVTAFPEDKQKAVNEYVRVTKPGGYVGLSEATWLKVPPPPELIAWASQDLGANIEPLTSSEWVGLLESAGLGEITAKTHTINVRNEGKGMLLRYGWGGMLRIFSRVLSLYATSPAYRKFVKETRENEITPTNLDEYFGYGLYVGRK